MIPDFPLGNLLIYLSLLISCFSWCTYARDVTAAVLFFLTSIVGALAIARLTVRSEAVFYQLYELEKKARGDK